MTPLKVINIVTNIKPSILENSALLSFLNALEAKLYKKVHDEEEYTPIEYEDIDTVELLLKEEHMEIYLYWLASQIDFFTNDIPSYNNSIEMYNAAFEDYTREVVYRKEVTPTHKYNYEGAFK